MQDSVKTSFCHHVVHVLAEADGFQIGLFAG